jgi:ubiquinone/menaquinone biosynthesis C-methylase UbiE
LFPRAEIFGADISSVALEQLNEKYAEFSGKTSSIHDNKTDFEDGFFDMVVSVEVMEHVDDVQAYLREIFRLLKPGGKFIWTTPCANRYSIEHIYSRAKKLIEATGEGYRRWTWEDPGHLRRLTSDEIEQLLLQSGFSGVLFRFRAHFFSFVCTQLRAKRIIPENVANYLMKFDYLFFKKLPNAASMIGCAIK